MNVFANVEKKPTVTVIIDNPNEVKFHFYWLSMNIEGSNLYSKSLVKDTIVIYSETPLELLTIDSQKDSQFKTTSNTFWTVNGDTIILRKNIEGFTYAVTLNNIIRNNELAFFPDMQKELGSYEGFGASGTSLKKTPSERIFDIRQLYKKRVEFLHNYKRTISQEFKENLLKKFYYSQYSDFFTPYFNPRMATLKIINFNDEVWGFIDELEFDLDFLTKRKDSHILFIIAYATFLRHNEMNDKLDLYHFIKNSYKDSARRDLALYQMIRFLVISGEEKVSYMINDFLISSYMPHLTSIVSENYSLFAKGISQQQDLGDLKNILLYDYNSGKEVSWGDLIVKNKGKVMYIDVWASWCGPCINEMPSSEELRKTFTNNSDVVFVYISQDDNQASWKKIISSKDYKWENNYLLLAGSKSEWLRGFNIKSIPKYLIVDKNGKIESFDAPRPSRLQEVKEKIVYLLK